MGSIIPYIPLNNHGFFHCSYGKHWQHHTQQPCISLTWARNSDTKPPFWQLTTSGHYSLGKKRSYTVLPKLGAHHFLRGRNHVGILQPRNASSCSLRFCSIACRRYIVGNMTFGVDLYGQKLFARHFFALAVAHVIHLQEMAPEKPTSGVN